MKIWHSYASAHSAGFVVWGTFATLDERATAEATLDLLLDALTYDQPPFTDAFPGDDPLSVALRDAAVAIHAMGYGPCMIVAPDFARSGGGQHVLQLSEDAYELAWGTPTYDAEQALGVLIERLGAVRVVLGSE